MADWDTKKTKTKGERDSALDEFWDVGRLVPDRPARRPMPPRRETPVAVEVEVTPPNPTAREDSSPHGTAAPVAAAPLTVFGGGNRGREGMDENGCPSPDPRPTPSPQPEPTPDPCPRGDIGHEPHQESAREPGHESDHAPDQGIAPPSHRATVTPTPISVEAVSDSTAAYAPPKRREGTDSTPPLAEYRPGGVLIHRVRVFGWQANYRYFDGFVEDALRYHAAKPPKTAEKASFFSYFPQYTQLSRRAEAWYLYWRELVRGGRYPDTDYAYILLYLFELINLPAESITEKQEHRDTMARVWMAYRRSYPQLDHYMCEWLCDYCLIHELTAPVDLLAPALDSIIQDSRLKEFYLSAALRVPADGRGNTDTALQTARILMRHCCQYDYRKSKFAQGEHKSLFDATIPGAVAHALPLLLGGEGDTKPVVTMLESTVTRDAYVGALCSYRNKRRIEVEYTSFSRSHELRFLMGDMVKHVENRLRSRIGVRSRLSVMALPTPLRDALDAYLAPLEPPKGSVPIGKREEPRPAYEALYDLPSKPVTLEDAAAIEAESWATTRILVEAFSDAQSTDDVSLRDDDAPLSGNAVAHGADDVSLRVDDAPLSGRAVAHGADDTPAAQVECPCGDAEADTSRGASSPLVSYAPFIKAALEGDSAALRAAAKSLGKMPDALADEINALTTDGEIGDIILEDDGMGGYTVIEDYRDAVAAMIQE